MQAMISIVFLMIFLSSTHAALNKSVIIKWNEVNDSKTIDEIIYILYTRTNSPEVFNARTGFKSFQHSKSTYVLIHGYRDSPDKSLWLPVLTEAMLRVYDCNVIMVNWSKYAMEPHYVEACRNTLPIGRNIGRFLSKLGINFATTQIAGYSLGGHVAGVVGRSIGSKILRIIAFDPALPGFTNTHNKYRLDASDAVIVEVIHTCAKVLGIAEPIGLRDFYANGGEHPQPGCRQVLPSCSHKRSCQYYSEALLSGSQGFITTRCDSYSDFKENICKGPFLPLANQNFDKNLNGTFYFLTNSASPFGKYNRYFKKNEYS